MNPPFMTADPALDLRVLTEAADRLGDAALRRQARDLAQRMGEGSVYLGCLGQFKRGKSTLLNALAGLAVLPVGVAPVTSVPTLIRYGPAPAACVRWPSGAWEPIAWDAIADFVTQQHNPDNRRQVAGVEVFAPAPLLASGLCLADTPGLGSVFGANTDATRAFLPHLDAALVVLGADPPISGAELDAVAEAAVHIRDFVFVLNKADRVGAAERAAALEFSRRQLESRLGCPVGPIHEICALEPCRQGADPVFAAGWAALLDALRVLASRSAARLRAESAARGCARLRDQLLRVVAQERDWLRQPLRAADEQAAELATLARAAQRSQADVAALLEPEQQRLGRLFAEKRRAFLRSRRPAAHAELLRRLAALPRRGGPSFRRAAMREAQESARSCLLPWFAAQEREAADEFRRSSERFRVLALDFLQRSAGFYAASSADLSVALGEASGFRFLDFPVRADPASPLRHLADAGLAVLRAWGLIERDAHGFLDRLLETNAHRVQSDLEERVAVSRRRIQREISALLGELAAQAEAAAMRVRQARREGEAGVAGRLELLLVVGGRLEDLWAPAAGPGAESQPTRPSDR